MVLCATLCENEARALRAQLATVGVVEGELQTSEGGNEFRATFASGNHCKFHLWPCALNAVQVQERLLAFPTPLHLFFLFTTCVDAS